MKFEDALYEARERFGKRELSDQAARTLAAQWASPGSVGKELAAVATGAWHAPMSSDRIDAFHADLHATFNGDPDPDHLTIWSMLGTWAMNGGDEDRIDPRAPFTVIMIDHNGDREAHGVFPNWQSAVDEWNDRRSFHTDTDGSRWVIVDGNGVDCNA